MHGPQHAAQSRRGATLALAGLAVYLVGGGGAAQADAAGVREVGSFGVDAGAYSYSSAVPVGSRARVQAIYTSSGQSIITLHVWAFSRIGITVPMRIRTAAAQPAATPALTSST